MLPDPRSHLPPPPALFTTTHWSVVSAAGDEESPEAQVALAKLCHDYWYPLYAYVRRQGHPEEEAKDLTQEFFARLLKRNQFRSLDRQKGKFRSWLIASMEHFLAKEWRDQRRLKRGGGQTLVSLDDDTAEDRYRREPVENVTAADLFDRRWALTVLQQAMDGLRQEMAAVERAPLLEHLQPFLAGDRAASGYATVAESLGMTEGAVKVAVHRLRKRYAELIRQEILQTVASPDDVDEELRYLLAALRAR